MVMSLVGGEECHQPLSKKVFVDSDVWVDYKIAGKLHLRSLIDDEIVSMRKNRDAFAHIESASNRDKAKKLVKLRAEIARLKAVLDKDGVTVEDQEAVE